MTWYRVGPAGIPGSLKTDMDAVLNKKFGTSTTYPPSDWAPTVNLLGPLPERTASGSIAHITDGADEVPIKSWLVSLPASLDGYSEVNGVQSGKNLMGASPSIMDSRYIVYWGNHSASGANDGVFLKAGTYTITFTKPTSMETANFGVYGAYVEDKTQITLISNTRNNPLSNTFVVPQDGTLNFWIYGTASEITVADIPLITCQIEVGSSATSYEAYSAPTTYTASLESTIYGGQADIVTGEGEATHTRYEITGAETGDFLAGTNNNGNRIGLSGFGLAQKPLYTGGVSNIGENKACLNSGTWTIGAWCIYTDNKLYFVVPNEYTTFATALQYLVDNNATFVFPLATSDTFTFTPIQAETELGANNFWAEEGDSDVTYRADIDLALNA